MLRRGQG